MKANRPSPRMRNPMTKVSCLQEDFFEEMLDEAVDELDIKVIIFLLSYPAYHFTFVQIVFS